MTDRIREHVKTTYGQIARNTTSSCSCGDASCCSGTSEQVSPSCCGDNASDSCCTPSSGYSAEELATLPQSAELGLGCGNPTALANLRPGETVLDLGCGGGVDVLLAAGRVGNGGRVYGIDLTTEMVELARRNVAASVFTNIEILHGDIETIPLPDGSVDVIISNCVINLTPDKAPVFKEAFRVLKPGGRLAVTDMMFQGDLSQVPYHVHASLDSWASCVAGALEQGQLTQLMREAGFTGVEVETLASYPHPELPRDVELVSGFLRGYRPASDPYALRPAQEDDAAKIRALLETANLPVAGLERDLPGGFVVAESLGRLVAVAGVESYNSHGLLRSVAVHPAWQKQGIATALVQDRLQWSRSQGLSSVWCLTTDAGGFFARLGFAAANRDKAPQGISNSDEFANICPETAELLFADIE